MIYLVLRPETYKGKYSWNKRLDCPAKNNFLYIEHKKELRT